MDIHYRAHKNIRRIPKPLDSLAQKSIIVDENIEDIIEQCFAGEEIIIHPFFFYSKYTMNQKWLMMTEKDVYMLLTEELCDFLDKIIGEKSAIEIGAGKGYLGRELGIHITDSYAKRYTYPMQRDQELGISTIVYPKDVEKLDAIKSVTKYHPHTVLSSFLVSERSYPDGKKYGVNKKELLKMCKRYIHIGNLDLHGDDPILNILHTEIEFPYLITKKMNPDTDRIFIWGNDMLDEFEKDNKLKHYQVSYEEENYGKYTTEFTSSDVPMDRLYQYAKYWVMLDVKKNFKEEKVFILENTLEIKEI